MHAWVLAYAVSMDLFITALQAVKQHFSDIPAKFKTSSLVEFQENEITLDIQDRKKLNQEGWIIDEVFLPAIVSLYWIQVWWL